MGPKICPETSVINYHYLLRNNPEDRGFLLKEALTAIRRQELQETEEEHVKRNPTIRLDHTASRIPGKTQKNMLLSPATDHVSYHFHCIRLRHHFATPDANPKAPPDNGNADAALDTNFELLQLAEFRDYSAMYQPLYPPRCVFCRLPKAS